MVVGNGSVSVIGVACTGNDTKVQTVKSNTLRVNKSDNFIRLFETVNNQQKFGGYYTLFTTLAQMELPKNAILLSLRLVEISI